MGDVTAYKWNRTGRREAMTHHDPVTVRDPVSFFTRRVADGMGRDRTRASLQEARLGEREIASLKQIVGISRFQSVITRSIRQLGDGGV